jgi:hypothetical protein
MDGGDFPELSLLHGTTSKEGGKQLNRAAASEDQVKRTKEEAAVIISGAHLNTSLALARRT